MIGAGGAMHLSCFAASWCSISGPSALAIAQALAESGVETIDLSWNCFGKIALSTPTPAGALAQGEYSVAEALSDSLAANSSLTHLDLRHNQLSREDCASLARGLEEWIEGEEQEVAREERQAAQRLHPHEL